MFAQLEPHIRVAPEHVDTQAPASQSWPDAHALPHVPQLATLLVVLMHVEPQVDNPAPQPTGATVVGAGVQLATRIAQPSAAPRANKRSLRLFMLKSLGKRP